MKRFFFLTLIVLLLPAFIFAGGQQDEDAAQPAETETAEATPSGATFSEPIIFATPAAYKEATGKTLPAYKESPMLASKVKAGELPPIEQRLPEEPAVMQPWNSVGTYSGDTPLTGSWRDLHCANAEHLLDVVAPNFAAPVPNVLKGYELAPDFTSITLFMRKGLKWSDGTPHTADDFMFWYEDVLLNDDLTPAKPAIYKPGGELMKVVKVDDYTVRFEFAAPYPAITDVLASDQWWQYPIPPKHYMQKWHIKYNKDADKVAQEEGFETWYQAYAMHNVTGSGQQDVDRPTVYPWIVVDIDSAQNHYMERNPYYWKVDVAGQQMPYIDEAFGVRVEDNEVKKLKVVSGEFHVGGVWQKLSDYPLYKDNAAQGDYRAMLWPDPRGSLDNAFTFNQTHKDPVMRELMSNIKFRQAVSLSFNREEMNDTLYFGMGVTRQASPPEPPASELFEPWMAEYYAEYDPDRANALLDEIGLKWDSNKEYRLRPDGKTLSVILQYIQRYDKVCQLTKDYWEAIGIKTTLKQVTGAMWNEVRDANEVDFGLWAVENTDFTLRRTAGAPLTPSWTGACVPWANWYNSGGATGQEPPAEVKNLYETVEKWTQTVPGSDEYLKLGKEAYKINVENLFVVGSVGLVPYPVVITNKLGNTMPDGSLWSPSYQQWVPYEAEQWYFK